MPAGIYMLASIGKWRYFLTGAALALLFGMVLRACGRVLTPLGKWRKFRGRCIASEPQNGKTAVLVQFTDRSRLTHTAALLTDEAPAPDQEISIAVRSDLFSSGAYPQTLAEANDREIIPRETCRKLLRKEIGKELLIGMLTSGIALAVFIFAMRLCFP